MANQSWKQQMYEQIANSQVQQVMQQQRAQQLQNDFANWQKQQNEIAQLQASFNEWKKSQPVAEAQPVQPAQPAQPVQTAQTIPSIKKSEPKRNLQAEAQEYFAKVREEREKEKKAVINETLNTLNSKEFKDMAKKVKAQSVTKQNPGREQLEDAIINQAKDIQTSSVRDMFGANNAPTNDIRSMLTQQPQQSQQSQKPSVNTTAKQPEKKTVEDVTSEDVARWLSPDTKLTQDEKKVARDYAAAELAKIPTHKTTHQPLVQTDEERQHYADMLEIMNKTNRISSAAAGYLDLPVNLVGLFGAGKDNENYRRSVANAQTQNPGAYGGGKVAGQLTAYALTSPVIGAATSAMGLSGLGAAAVNQVFQAGQDVALDVLPEAQRMLREEGKINWGELAKRFGVDVTMNLAMQTIPSLGGAEWDYLTKSVGNDADIFKQFKQSGAYKTIPNAANNIIDAVGDVKANEAAENVAKMKMLPGMETEADVVNDINRQLSEAMSSYHPETSAMKNIYSAEDLTNSLNEQLTNAMKASQADEVIESAAKSIPEAPVNEVAESVDDVAKAVNDISPIKADIDDMSDVVTNRIYDVGYKVDAANNEALSKSYRELLDYEEKWAKTVSESNDIDEIKRATKDLNNAISRFNTRAKKVDPSISKDIYNRKFSTMLNSFNNKLDDFYNGARRTEEAANTIAEMEGAKPRSVMAEDIGLDNAPKGRPVTSEPIEPGKYEIPDTPENAPTETAEDLWNQLKAGESNSMPNNSSQIPMNLQALGEEPTSRAGRILRDIKNGEDVVEGQGTKVSEFYNNSMQRNKYAWDAEDLNDLYTSDRFEYLPTSERNSVQNAFDNVKANRNSLIDRYTKQADSITRPKDMKQFYNSQDIDQMHLLIRDLRRKQALATDPAQKALFEQQRYEITKHLYDATHSGASVMQAGQKWLDDVDGILDTAESYRIKKANDIFADNPNLKQEADRVAEDIYNRFKELEKNNFLVDLSEAERKTRLRELIDEALSNSEVKRRLGQGDIENLVNDMMQTPTAERISRGIEDALTNIGWIKDETVREVDNIWATIENLDPGSKDFQKGVTRIYTLIANDIGGSGTFWDKVDSWRYLAMLANPTTHIRNILGNITMNGMAGIKNNIAAGIEAVADKASKNGIQGGRTKAILTLKDGDLLSESAKYFDNHAYGEYLQGGNRYMSASVGIDDAIPTFKTKALDKAAKGHSNLLSAEDVKFGKAKYKTSLAGFLKANGADASIFNATDTASKDLLERANKYALEAANEATFHTNSTAANALSQFSKNLRASDNVFAKAAGIAIDTTVPFKKTPINILKNCFEYSPVEFGRVLMDIGKWRKGTITTAKMIDNLSKAITGTGGMAIGALLAHEGYIKVTNGTNKEQSFDKLSGQQAVALKIFGHDIDISFLPPSVMPLIMGATLLNDYKEKYGDDYSALDVLTSSLTDPDIAANTALESLDTIVDTTMLSGINDVINTIRYAEKPQDVAKSVVAKTATNFASQMIPTLAKKTASVVDDKKYSSYSDKTGAAKTLDSSLKYLKTTIPGLQQAGKAMEGSSNRTIAKIGDAITAEPKINGWGEAEKKEDYGWGIGGRAIDQYLNPATTTKNTEDRTTQEIRSLSKRLNDDSILDIGNISTSESKFSLNNQQYKLNEKQWTTYSRIEGHTAKDLADSYVRGEQWNNDTDQDRADTVKKMKSFSKAYAQSKVTGADMSSTNKELAKIYEKDGAKGLIEEFHRQTVFSKYEVSKSDGANAVYQDLGEKGVEKYAKFKKKLGDSTKSEDVEKMLNSSGMSKSDKAKYYSYLKPSATPGNNPYGYIPGVSYDPEKDESYQKAVKAIPSLKPEKYYETKDTIDSDKNGTLKQEELINYINSKAKSNDEAQKMWAAYGGWTNKEGQIKKLVGSPGHYTSSY